MTLTTPDATTELPRPPYDPELRAVLTVFAEQMPPLTVEALPIMRQSMPTSVTQLLEGHPVEHVERTIPGPDGAPDILVSIFRRSDHTTAGPAIYNIHGGGMVIGDRFIGADLIIDCVEKYDAVGVSVEYRLAPENPDPAPVEDCYAGLVWMADNAAELGFDPARLIVVGGSAGGGLAAGVALLARDRRGPALVGQLLTCPMLDDRNETVSSRQFTDPGTWNRQSNFFGWSALLGGRRGTDEVSIYAAPSRSTDLTNLPPAFIDVGSAEVFRDEDVAYATAIWAAGGQAELHVWPGGFHGFAMLAPQAAVSRAALDAMHAWIRRTLGV